MCWQKFAWVLPMHYFIFFIYYSWLAVSCSLASVSGSDQNPSKWMCSGNTKQKDSTYKHRHYRHHSSNKSSVQEGQPVSTVWTRQTVKLFFVLYICSYIFISTIPNFFPMDNFKMRICRFMASWAPKIHSYCFSVWPPFHSISVSASSSHSHGSSLFCSVAINK